MGTATTSRERQRIGVAFNVLRLLDRPDSTGADVAEALEKDETLGRQVLRMARSPLCGLRSPDLTVARAVVLLGFVTIRKLVVLSLCRDLGSIGSAAEPGDANRWRRALWVGIAAEEITRRYDERAASEALMAGVTSVMADAFASYGNPDGLDVTPAVDPERMQRFLGGAEGLARLIIEARPGLPPTTAVDDALEEAGLMPLYDGRLAVDIRRGYELYASLLS